MAVGLVHSVDILRENPTGGEDAWGLPSEAVVTVATGIPALVQGRTSREQPRPTGVEITDTLIFLPLGTNVRADDLILHGSKGYRVVGIPIDAGGASHHLEIGALRTDLGG